MHDLKELTVHRAPMLLLDGLLEHGEDFAISQVDIHPKMLFVEPQGLPVWVGIELMAQTIALLSGLRDKQRGRSPQIGFLLGSRQFHAPMTHFPIGARLRIHAQEYFIDTNGLGQYIGTIDSTVGQVTAKLNVYQPTASI